MSSIANFYLLAASDRAVFNEACLTQKRSVKRRFLFFSWNVIEGDRCLSEYIDSLALSEFSLPFSGFFLIRYLFEFLDLPTELRTSLNASSIDDYYTLITPDLAASLADYLDSHQPDEAVLEAFLRKEGLGSDPDDVATFIDTHQILTRWFRRVTPSHFGILAITF